MPNNEPDQPVREPWESLESIDWKSVVWLMNTHRPQKQTLELRREEQP